MNAPLYALATPNTARGRLASLWNGIVVTLADVLISDDFTERRSATGTTAAAVTGGWSVVDSAEAGGNYSLATKAGVGGQADLGSDGTTAQYGVEAQYVPAMVNLPTHGSAAGGRVVMQSRVDFGDGDTTFIGLGEAGDNFLSATSQLPTDKDYCGFYTEDAGATLKFVCANDNAGGTAVTDSYTLPDELEDGFNNVGFSIGADGRVTISLNDHVYGPEKNGILRTALPIETVTPRMSTTAGTGTTAPTITLDSVECVAKAA